MMSTRSRHRTARAVFALSLAAALLSGCARFSDSPPRAEAPPPPVSAAASGPFDRAPSCAREGDACGPQAECCGGLVCIGTRTSFCVSRS